MNIHKKGHKLLIDTFFLAPITLILIGVLIIPIVYAGVLSFYSWNLVLSPVKRFVGFKNYLALFSNPFFYGVLKTTGIYTGCCVGIQFSLGLMLALAVEAGFKRRLKGVRIATALLMMPMSLSPILIGYFFKVLYSPQLGLFNQVLSRLGFEPLEWTYSKNTALASLIIADTSQWTSIMFIVLLGGLLNLPEGLFEAAKVDGAQNWQIFFFLKLPLLRPFIQVALLVRIMDSIKYLDLVYVLTKGGPGSATEILSYYTYRTGFIDFYMGKGSAIAITEFALMAFLCFLLIKSLRLK